VIDPKRVKERIFKALKSQGYQIKMYDDEGMSTVDPELTSRFYVDEPNLLIHVDEEEDEVNFNKNGNVPLSEYESAMRAVKAVAKEYMYKTTIRDYGKRITPKDFSYQTKIGDTSMDNVQESAMYGTKKTSRQMVENVCIVAKHKKEVDENVRGSRSRNIQAIFLESNGERYKFPYNNLNGARAMARHIARGGSTQDTIGESITSMTGKMIELREFYSYSKRNKLISEDTTDVIEALKESINSIAGDLKAVYGTRSYATASQRISEQENFIAENEDGTDYRDMFTVKKFDEKFEAVLPVVSSIVQERNMKLRRIEESSLATVKATPFAFNDSKAITYESQQVKMGHKLRSMSKSISENSELAAYLESIGNKMISEAEVTEFERSVVRNVLENITEVSETEPQDLISESLEELYDRLTDIEDIAYDNMINEGIGDMFSNAAQKFKSFFRSANDDLMDLGTRLKQIQSMMNDNGVEEAAAGIGDAAKADPKMMHFKMAVNRFNAARKGLSYANKLKDRAEKSKHQSQIMKNINKLRRDVEWLENHFEMSKSDRPQMPSPSQFNKGTTWN
jgi:hemoglobin-like flavoprotein